jgi:hypothetical protein
MLVLIHIIISPVTNTMPMKGKTQTQISPTDTSKESVYVLGSFTYGAKLWPACLAVSLGRSVGHSAYFFITLFIFSDVTESITDMNR